MEWLNNLYALINEHSARATISIGTLLLVTIIYWLINSRLMGHMIKRSKTKRQKSHIYTIMNFLKYFYIFIIILIVIVTFTGGSLAGLSLSAGFLTAALGWALQRPITGVAAWIMVIIKRPFSIGDRISIGTVKGEVKEISPTHITLSEVGGTIESEEISGRIIVIPNAVLFEQNIINYTQQDDYVLDQVTTQITYESDLDEALKLCVKAAEKVTRPYEELVKVKPHTIITFAPSGIDVKTRYMAIAYERSRIYSQIAEEIFRGIRKAKRIDIAYPHLVMMDK